MRLTDLKIKLIILTLEASKMNKKINYAFDELDKLIDNCCEFIKKSTDIQNSNKNINCNKKS